jgi:prepilin-type processing-associated H-X9-DG protein
MYANDNTENLAFNGDRNAPGVQTTPSWVYSANSTTPAKYLTWGTDDYNTNTSYIISDQYSSLGNYVAKSIGIFHCPADNYLSTAQKSAGWIMRDRSCAMDAAIGGGAKFYAGQPWFYNVTKTSGFHTPAPSDSFLLLDEHPDSIDDGAFYYDPTSPTFIELPAMNHGGSSGISFADGHSQLYKMQMGVVPVTATGSYVANAKYSNVADQAWFAQHTPQN